CGDLAEAVRSGRKAEFAEAYAGSPPDIPDPLSEANFRSGEMRWDARDAPLHRERLELVRRLLAFRKAVVVPLIPQLATGQARAQVGSGYLQADWGLKDGRALVLLANISPRT